MNLNILNDFIFFVFYCNNHCQMKSILSLVLISFLFQSSLKCQGVNLNVSTLAGIDNVIIGPNNVDRYFPRQAENYIEQYFELREKLAEEIVKEELRIKLGKSKFADIDKPIEEKDIMVLGKLGLEFIDQLISDWSEHQLNSEEFYEYFDQKLDSMYCYTFLYEGDTLQNDMIEISNVEGGFINKYYEFVKGTIVYAGKSPEVFKSQAKSRSKEDVYKDIEKIFKAEIVVNEADLEEYLSFYRHHNEQVGIQNERYFLDMDDLRVIEKVEFYFSPFTFDPYEIELYRAIEFIPEESFPELKIIETGLYFIPDYWFRSDCE